MSKRRKSPPVPPVKPPEPPQLSSEAEAAIAEARRLFESQFGAANGDKPETQPAPKSGAKPTPEIDVFTSHRFEFPRLDAPNLQWACMAAIFQHYLMALLLINGAFWIAWVDTAEDREAA